MANQGPSIADIQAARNSKLADEQANNPSTDRIVSELEGAHQDALRLQEEQGQPSQHQAFPHGSLMGDNKTGVREKVAEGIAESDQTVTTAARNAVHRLSEGMSAAGNTVANAAGAAIDKAKETMGTGAANDGGRHTTGYEGATFSSDDPDYNKTQSGVSESHTPAHTLDELKNPSSNPSGTNPTIATPKEDTRPWGGLSSLLFQGLGGKAPVIATPREGIAVGDQSGGANITATAESYTKSITSAVKDAFSRVTPGPATPAGPSDQDPRTANVPVGDFKALHQALGLAHSDTSNDTSSGGTDTSSGGSNDGSNAAGSSAIASDSSGSTDQASAGKTPSMQDVKEGWEGVKAEAQQGVDSAKASVNQGLATASDKVQQGLAGAAEQAQEATGSKGASAGTTATGGGLLGGLAGIVSGIATKVNLANSSEELMAGGTVPDAAAAPAAADGPTATPAPEASAAADAAADTAAKLGGSSGGSSDAVTAAKDMASDTAERVKQGAAELRDKAAEQASAAGEALNAAKDTVVDATRDGATQAAEAATAAKDRVVNATSDGAGQVSETAGAARDQAAAAAGAARDNAAEASNAARDQAADAAGDAKASAGGALSHLVQGAKEGFVGAYDAAASLLVGDDPKATPTPDTSEANASPPPAAEAPNNVTTGGIGLKSGAVGSGHAAAPNAGIGAVLQQGWEDLKHGGAKAPHATSTGGETSAAHDVTSNIERSKHLNDDHQAKIYKAETYSVSPGAQAASDQAASDAKQSGVVAGDKRQVTGTVPHDKPDSYRVQAGQGTRFDGNKGIGTSFGTGSAAPWTGDDSIKRVSGLFSNSHSSLNMGGLSPEEQARLVDAAAQAAAAGPERSSSSTEGSVGSWVNSMSAVWRHLGVASAKGPTGKDVKDIQFETPDQDAVVDPERGVTLKEGHSPGHKIQMRTREQVPPPQDVTDPQFYKDKEERLGKVIKDTLTTTNEEAARDPNNLKGKSSDNRPDGLAHYTKLESQEAADSLSKAPQATASALGTAGEMVAGAAGHVVDKVKEVGANIVQHGDILHPDDRMAKSQAAVDRGHKMLEQMGDVATDHRAVAELQQEHLAVIGEPAHKRDTFGDKVIGPLVKDTSDDSRARELAASYNEWKKEKEEGKTPTQNLSPATAGTPEGTGAATGASSGSAHTGFDSSGSSGGGSSGSSGGSGSSDAGVSSGGVTNKVTDLGQEAVDTARSTQEVVKMEGQAAGGAVESAANQAGSAVGGAVDAVKGLATEAVDTARAAGEVVSMEASSATDAVKGTSDKAAAATSDAAHDAQRTARHATGSARDTAQQAADSARGTARHATDSALDTAQQAADRGSAAASDVADRTREGAREAKEGIKDAAGSVRDSVKDTASRAGDAVQQGVDAVAEGTGRVTGAGAERVNEAQEAAAQAGQKAGAVAGGVLASVGETAKGLLGALLGPFEREGAFDESTAALTGPPKDFGPVGAEQVSGADMSSSQAPAVKHTPDPVIKRATQGPSFTAAAPAGSDAVAEAKATAQETKEGIKATAEETKEGIKARLQAGIDDTARAAGLTVGHIESAVEGAKQQFASVQDKIAATTRNVTEDIHVPPAELTTNTEELLKQRAAAGKQ